MEGSVQFTICYSTRACPRAAPFSWTIIFVVAVCLRNTEATASRHLGAAWQPSRREHAALRSNGVQSIQQLVGIPECAYLLTSISVYWSVSSEDKQEFGSWLASTSSDPICTCDRYCVTAARRPQGPVGGTRCGDAVLCYFEMESSCGKE